MVHGPAVFYISEHLTLYSTLKSLKTETETMLLYMYHGADVKTRSSESLPHFKKLLFVHFYTVFLCVILLIWFYMKQL